MTMLTTSDNKNMKMILNCFCLILWNTIFILHIHCYNIKLCNKHSQGKKIINNICIFYKYIFRFEFK